MATELTTVSTVDPIKVYFNISEREYLKVAGAADAMGKKQNHVPLELFLVDGSIYPYPGQTSVLNRQVDVSTGTFKVAALFPNPNNLLRPGQYGKVRATMAVDKGALLVPQRAVTEIPGGDRNPGQVPGGGGRCREQGRHPPGERRRADRFGLDHQQGAATGRAGDRRRNPEGPRGNGRQPETLCARSPRRHAGQGRRHRPRPATSRLRRHRRARNKRPCPSSSSTGRSLPWSFRS